jgi:hypothetical protein
MVASFNGPKSWQTEVDEGSVAGTFRFIGAHRHWKSELFGDSQLSPQNLSRILIVDDHQLLREGIATIINTQPDMQLVSQASSGPEAIQQYCEHRQLGKLRFSRHRRSFSRKLLQASSEPTELGKARRT